MALWNRIGRSSTYSPSSLTPFFCHRRSISMSQAPAWLKPVLSDTTAPPTLYAWTPANLNLPYTPQPKHSRDEASRIYIIGLGNLGRMYAAYLSLITPTPPPITLVVHRESLLSQWTENSGVEVTRQGVLHQSKAYDIEYWSEDNPTVGPVQEVQPLRSVLVTTKATAAMPSVDRIRRYLNADSTVAFAQNGMSKLWPPHGSVYMTHRYPNGNAFNALLCVTNHGVLSEGPFKSLHASPANVSIGCVFPGQDVSQNYLAQQILAAPFVEAKSYRTADLWVVQLEKLVVNACLNPLTALLRQKNGFIFQNPDGPILKVLDCILAEASAVLQALVKSDASTSILESSSDKDIETLRSTLVERFSFEKLKALVYTVGEKVKENRSSMLQDVCAGKSTEIRDFNGWLVDMAAFLDASISVSTNQKLVDLVENGAAQLDETSLAMKVLS